MLFPAKESAYHGQLSRRSQRKTKKIDRDQHAHPYPKVGKPKGRSMQAGHACFDGAADGQRPRLAAFSSAKDEQ